MTSAMSTSSPEFDEQMMRRAIRLAMNGRGGVEPNPMVGCVIVKDGRVIGEGFHAQYGGPHAEPTALAACAESPAGATAYVTLEPCCHTNKKTPPCAPRLIEAKIARVVIGCRDPNPDVNGKGLAMLRPAGIEVDGPVLEASAKQLIAPFFAAVNHARPYVTLKWAQSADAKVAGARGRRAQISNLPATRSVHELRARCDAILIGSGTALVDDPTLMPRGVTVFRKSIRAILDTELCLPLRSNLVRTATDAPVVVYCDEETFQENSNRVDELNAAGVEVVAVASGLRITDVLHDLKRRAVTHVLVEPGPLLARSFPALAETDRLWIVRSPIAINDETAPRAASVASNYVITGEVELAGDVLTEYLNASSDAFFSSEPSADLLAVNAARE